MPTIPYVKNPTWADGSGGGTSIDAADLNKVEAGIFEISYAPCVRVTHNAAQSITSGVGTALAFNSERFDQAGNAADTMHDTVTNNSRLTCRYAGVYQITGNIIWAANNTGQRGCAIRLNGTTFLADSTNDTAGTGTTNINVTTLYALAVNDFVELVVTQSSGGALNVNTSGNISPEFMMVRVG